MAVARPIGAIAYRLLARRQGGIRSDLDPPVNLVTMGTPSGYDVWLGLVAAPGSGRSRTELADGDYIVEASSPLYQRLEADVTVPLDPASPGRFDLEPGYGYPFPRTSTLFTGTGPDPAARDRQPQRQRRPALAGMTSSRYRAKSSSYQTDGTGRWVMVFPDHSLPGWSPSGSHSRRAVRSSTCLASRSTGASNAIQQTALYGKVLAGDRPARGCAVEVLGRAGQVLADVAGAWLYYLDLGERGGQVAVRATLPDSRTATQRQRAGAAAAGEPRAHFPLPVTHDLTKETAHA